MIFEYLFISILILSGYGVLSISSFVPLEKSLFALPVAICLYIIITYVQIIFGLSTSYYVTTTALLIIAISCALVHLRNLKNKEISYIVLVLVVFGAVFFISNEISLVKYHFDSIRYLTTSSLLAHDKFDEVVGYALRKRFTPISILNGPAHLSGNFYLRSLTPAIAVNLVLILYYTVYSTFDTIYGSVKSHLLAISASLLLVSINRTVFNAFYINNHLLEALYVFLVAGSAWLCARGRLAPGPATFLIGLSVFGVVICRSEGFIMAGLVLLPILLSDTLPKSNRIALGQIWALSVLIHVAPIVLRAVDAGDAIPGDTAKILLSAAIICVASPAVYLSFSRETPTRFCLWPRLSSGSRCWGLWWPIGPSLRPASRQSSSTPSTGAVAGASP